MPDSKRLALVVLMLFLVAPVVASADCNTCVLRPPHQGSWMQNLTMVQMLNNPHDYAWTIGSGTWSPYYDYDWQKHYCGYQEHVQVCACSR